MAVLSNLTLLRPLEGGRCTSGDRKSRSRRWGEWGQVGLSTRKGSAGRLQETGLQGFPRPHIPHSYPMRLHLQNTYSNIKLGISRSNCRVLNCKYGAHLGTGPWVTGPQTSSEWPTQWTLRWARTRCLGEGDSPCVICIWNLFSLWVELETYKMRFYLIKCGLTIGSSTWLKLFTALLHQIKGTV